jgi:predicted DNA-binding protein with PD1-like motif
MKSKQLANGTETSWVVIFEIGEEVTTGLERFAVEHNLSASRFTAIGAFSNAVLGYFDLYRKDYKRIPIAEQVEVLSLIGDVTLSEEGPTVHAHVVVGKSDGTAHGGHLLEAYVRPTLEVIITESPRHLSRRTDPALGLALVTLD